MFEQTGLGLFIFDENKLIAVHDYERSFPAVLDIYKFWWNHSWKNLVNYVIMCKIKSPGSITPNLTNTSIFKVQDVSKFSVIKSRVNRAHLP